MGAATTFVLTDMSKFTVGRLRPHFLSLCEANLTDGICKEDGREDGYPKFVVGKDRDIANLCQSYMRTEDNTEDRAIIDKVKQRMKCRLDIIEYLFTEASRGSTLLHVGPLFLQLVLCDISHPLLARKC